MNQKERKGKTVNVPEKMGMKAITREGFDYEMTIAFELAVSHLAQSTKDRTGLFQDKPEEIITEEYGKRLAEWNESGAPAPKDYAAIKRRIVKEARRLGLNPMDGETFPIKVKEWTGFDLVEENFETIADLFAGTEELKKEEPKNDNDSSDDSQGTPPQGESDETPPKDGGWSEKDQQIAEDLADGKVDTASTGSGQDAAQGADASQAEASTEPAPAEAKQERSAADVASDLGGEVIDDDKETGNSRREMMEKGRQEAIAKNQANQK